MMRDMEVVRKILLEIEARAAAPQRGGALKIDGVEDEVVQYHLEIMEEAGLISAVNASSFSGRCWLPRRLTWQGHEFLDAARDETIWRKAREYLGSKLDSAGFAVLLEVLKDQTRKALGLA